MISFKDYCQQLDEKKNITESRAEKLKAWHSDSHPVTKNEDGSPKTFYHGTAFDINRFWTKPGQTIEGAAFFSAHPKVAVGFAHQTHSNNEEDAESMDTTHVTGPVVYPVHIHMKNPMVIPASDILQGEHHSFDLMQAATTKARELGHDGLYIKDVPDMGFKADQIAAFHPEQIKSATGNGTFDRSKKKITEETNDAKKTHRSDGIYFHFHEPQEENEDGDGFMVQARDPSKKDATGNDLVVGHLHVPYDYFRSTKFTAGDVFVHASHRRRGIATDMYKHMAKNLSDVLGRPVNAKQSWQQSSDGKAMWGGFKKKGLFEELTEATAETYKTRKVYKLGSRPDGVYFTAERSWDQTDDANYDKHGNPVDDDGWFVHAHDSSIKTEHGDLEVGHLHVPYDNMFGDHFHAGDVQVHTSHLRRGIAGDMYKHMAKHLSKMEGQPMHPTPSSTQSDDGKAMWNGFKKKGLFDDPESALAEAKNMLEMKKSIKEAKDDIHPALKYGDGAPREFYHGTNSNFKKFDSMYQADENAGGNGFYFTDDHETAQFYARRYEENGAPRVMTVRLHLKNLLDARTKEGQKRLKEIGGIDSLEHHGHDGLIFTDWTKGKHHTSYVALRPHQIEILKNEKMNPIKEETMTRKLTLSVVEQEKKVAQLTEETKDLPMFDAAQKFADAGIELSESMYDEKIASPHAMDRFYIATHGTDAHRDQLVKDEDAMVRFGVAKTGQLTHLNQLANDPSPMVRDQVARRGDEELAKKLASDPHPMVRSSAYNRMQEFNRTVTDPAVISSENGGVDGVTESVQAPKHFEADETIQVKSDGRFAKVKTVFETKDDSFWYAVSLPNGGSEVLHESEVRSLEEGVTEEKTDKPSAGDSVLLKGKDHWGTLYTIHGDKAQVSYHYPSPRRIEVPVDEIVKFVRPTLTEDRENEHNANLSLAGEKSPSKPNKPVKLKRADGSIHSEHENETSALNAYKNEPDNKGMKIVRESYLDPTKLAEDLADAAIEYPEIGLSVHSPDQLDPHDREKAYANECPFCNPELHDGDAVGADEHQAAMNYHTEQAKRTDLSGEERHFHSRQFMKHQKAL